MELLPNPSGKGPLFRLTVYEGRTRLGSYMQDNADTLREDVEYLRTVSIKELEKYK